MPLLARVFWVVAARVPPSLHVARWLLKCDVVARVFWVVAMVLLCNCLGLLCSC